MRVSAIKYNNISFQRRLSKEEEQDFSKTVLEADAKIGRGRQTYFIIPDISIPQSAEYNTGTGSLTSKKASEFLKFINTYAHPTHLQHLPQGQMEIFDDGVVINYTGSGLSLGDQVINPELLTHKDYGSILKKEEFRTIVNANKNKDKSIANYENIIKKDSPQEKALRKAYERFKTSKDPNVQKLKVKMSEFMTANKDWMEPKGVFSILETKNETAHYPWWNDELERNLYNPDFDENIRKAKIDEIISKNQDEIGFFNFKQFLAQDHLRLGRKNVNNHGMKLVGDCLINFSSDEIWANPKAFIQDAVLHPEWTLKPLNHYDLENENSYASKLLKRKVVLFAQRYDGIRFDVGWSYVNGKISYKTPKGWEIVRHNLGSKVLELIEKTVQAVKGEDFDLKELIYEFEAGYNDLAICDGPGGLHPAVRGRTKIYGSDHMDSQWGSHQAFSKRGWSPDEVIIGTVNHDGLNTRTMADLIDVPADWDLDELKAGKEKQIKALAEIFNINPENLRSNPTEFMRYKFAEPMAAKRKQLFFMEFFGRKEQFDAHTSNTTQNYRYMVPENFETAYHSSIQKGFGFNIMDALAETYKRLGLDKTEKELFDKIMYYRNELIKPDIVEKIVNEAGNTIKEADKIVTENVKENIEETIIESFEESKKTASHNRFLKPILIGATFIAAAGVCICAVIKKQKASTEKLKKVA